MCVVACLKCSLNLCCKLCVVTLGLLDVNAVPALYTVAIVVAGLTLDSFLVFKMSGSNAGSTEVKKNKL